jgi:hypothetical protein
LKRIFTSNHLIKNYKALYFLGEFFKIERYIKRAERLYQNHIDKQFTPAGMHEELSPMYSAIILEDLIERVMLLNVAAYMHFERRVLDYIGVNQNLKRNVIKLGIKRMGL